MRRFRLTFFFIVASMITTGAASGLADRVVGELAIKSLGRTAQESTARDVGYIESTVPSIARPRGERSTQGISSAAPNSETGAPRRLDVVQTYMPLREGASDPIIGVIQVYKDTGGDITTRTHDGKARLLRMTLVAQGVLLFVLFGLVVIAELAIDQHGRLGVSLLKRRAREA